MNDDEYGSSIREIIKYRIADEAFGLEPADTNSMRVFLFCMVSQVDTLYLSPWIVRYKTCIIANNLPVASTPPPPNASLPVSFDTLQGQYQNLWYREVKELCAPSAESKSASCTAILATVNATFPTQLASADLIMDWGGFLLSYVTLKHFDGALFNVTGWRQFVREISPSMLYCAKAMAPSGHRKCIGFILGVGLRTGRDSRRV